MLFRLGMESVGVMGARKRSAKPGARGSANDNPAIVGNKEVGW